MNKEHLEKQGKNLGYIYTLVQLMGATNGYIPGTQTQEAKVAYAKLQRYLAKEIEKAIK